jgi:hypothetical protein
LFISYLSHPIAAIWAARIEQRFPSSEDKKKTVRKLGLPEPLHLYEGSI